jgi:LPS sulfotransferase NodH
LTNTNVAGVPNSYFHKTGPAETGMFGLKLQGGSLNYFMDRLKLLHPEPNSDVERLNTTFGEGAFFFLSRKNKRE